LRSRFDGWFHACIQQYYWSIVATLLSSSIAGFLPDPILTGLIRPSQHDESGDERIVVRARQEIQFLNPRLIVTKEALGRAAEGSNRESSIDPQPHEAAVADAHRLLLVGRAVIRAAL